MSKTIERRTQFADALERVFEGYEKDWFVGFDQAMADLAEKWDKAMEEFGREFHTHSKVEKVDAGHYRIDIDVDGYEKADLKVEKVGDELVVTGNHEEGKSHESFRHSFLIADDLKVDDVKLDDDHLVIEVSAPETVKTEVETLEIH